MADPMQMHEIRISLLQAYKRTYKLTLYLMFIDSIANKRNYPEMLNYAIETIYCLS